MRAICRYRVSLASGRLGELCPRCAVEPDAPQALITRAEAIRIAVQANLSAKFTTTTDSKKASRGRWSNITRFADQTPAMGR